MKVNVLTIAVKDEALLCMVGLWRFKHCSNRHIQSFADCSELICSHRNISAL